MEKYAPEERIMNKELERTTIHSFTDLKVWNEAHTLAITIYTISKVFPKEEVFGLTSQIRRSAVSVTANIAEGFSRTSWKEKASFYSIALGSLPETQSHLLISRDIGYLSEETYAEILPQVVLVSKLCNGLIKKTRSISSS